MNLTLMASSDAAGFITGEVPNWENMAASAQPHSCLHPKLVMMWGAAWHAAEPCLSVLDASLFPKTPVFDPWASPPARLFSARVPFLRYFDETPCAVFSTVNTCVGLFRPSWVAGLLGITSLYGSIDTSRFRVVRTRDGKTLKDCKLDISNVAESAAAICDVTEPYLNI